MATAVKQFRPFIVGKEAEGLNWFQKINFKWLLQRIPMLFFATVSSYGVGHFLFLSGLPEPFYQLGGVSFDVGFLGVIALADMQLTKTVWNKVAYYVLNASMSGLAALFNVLSHAGGKYENITPEAITAGVPFAIIGLAFALYYETVMSGYMDQEAAVQMKQQVKDDATKEPCDYCGEGKKNKAAVYGHYKSCAMKTMHLRNPDPSVCKCLRCHPK